MRESLFFVQCGDIANRTFDTVDVLGQGSSADVPTERLPLRGAVAESD